MHSANIHKLTITVLALATITVARPASAQVVPDVHKPPAANSPVAAQLPTDYTSRLGARLGETHVVTGAAIGLVAGAGAAYLLLYSGGSTSRCDRDANQDALNRRECVGLVIGGGVVGAVVGALVGNRVRRGGTDLLRSPELRRATTVPAPAL
jgi:hypothetical protein